MPSCFIIGVGPGLSAGIARRFSEGGYSVGLISRSAEQVRPLTEELSCGAGAAFECADAADADALSSALGRLEEALEPPEVLIYNPSVMRSEGPLEVELQTVRDEFELNVIGALNCAQCVASGMKARGKGSIVFTGGGLALEPYPEWTSLALGKAALRSLGLSLYKELAPYGVHVSVVAVCGIVDAGGPFDPDRIAQEYWRVATDPNGVIDREIIFQPEGSDPFYNDPERKHHATSVSPALFAERLASRQ